MKVVGLVDLNLLFLLAGTAALYGVGLVRSWRDGVRLAGLALLVGWAAIGLLASFALMAGASLAVWQTLALGAALAVAGLVAGRRVPRLERERRWTAGPAAVAVAAGGGALLLAYVGALFRGARLAEPVEWDAWAFWVPKAEAIVYRDGLGTGPGSVSSFANPDYPPFVPAVDALAFRFADAVDPGLLPVQHWVLSAAFLAALVGLLWHRVSPAVLLPSVAALALMPLFGEAVGSLLAEDSLVVAFGVAAAAGALWLLEREPRYLVLFALFAAALSLMKDEGFAFAVVMALLLVALTARPRRVAAAVLAAPLLALAPWKVWTRIHDVPQGAIYDFRDLADPAFLAERADRLTTALEALPAYYASFDRSLVVVPVLLALAVLAVRVRPRLAAFALVTFVVAFVGNAVVYWISDAPLEWYIDTSAERTSTGPVVFAAVLVPLLAAELLAAYGAVRSVGSERTSSPRSFQTSP